MKIKNRILSIITVITIFISTILITPTAASASLATANTGIITESFENATTNVFTYKSYAGFLQMANTFSIDGSSQMFEKNSAKLKFVGSLTGLQAYTYTTTRPVGADGFIFRFKTDVGNSLLGIKINGAYQARTPASGSTSSYSKPENGGAVSLSGVTSPINMIDYSPHAGYAISPGFDSYIYIPFTDTEKASETVSIEFLFFHAWYMSWANSTSYIDDIGFYRGDGANTDWKSLMKYMDVVEEEVEENLLDTYPSVITESFENATKNVFTYTDYGGCPQMNNSFYIDENSKLSGEKSAKFRYDTALSGLQAYEYTTKNLGGADGFVFRLKTDVGNSLLGIKINGSYQARIPDGTDGQSTDKSENGGAVSLDGVASPISMLNYGVHAGYIITPNFDSYIYIPFTDAEKAAPTLSIEFNFFHAWYLNWANSTTYIDNIGLYKGDNFVNIINNLGKPIKIGINEEKVTTPATMAPILPSKATIKYSNGINQKANVIWDAIDLSLYAQNKVGTSFNVVGTVEGSIEKANCKVTVTALTAQNIAKTITSIPDVEYGDASIIMPVIHNDYNIEIKASSELGVIDLNGNVTQTNDTKIVSLTFKIAKKVDSTDNADTASIPVNVYGRPRYEIIETFDNFTSAEVEDIVNSKVRIKAYLEVENSLNGSKSFAINRFNTNSNKEISFQIKNPLTIPSDTTAIAIRLKSDNKAEDYLDISLSRNADCFKNTVKLFNVNAVDVTPANVFDNDKGIKIPAMFDGYIFIPINSSHLNFSLPQNLKFIFSQYNFSGNTIILDNISAISASPSSFSSIVSIIESDTPPIIDIANINTAIVKIPKGVAPIFPNTVVVNYKGDIKRKATVVWEVVDSNKYNTAGSFDVEGSISGIAEKAICNVRVLADAGAVAQTISSIVNPIKNITYLSFPSISEDYFIEISSSTNENVVSKSGRISLDTSKDNSAKLVLTVTRKYDYQSANTQAITVTVPKASYEINTITNSQYGFSVTGDNISKTAKLEVVNNYDESLLPSKIKGINIYTRYSLSVVDKGKDCGMGNYSIKINLPEKIKNKQVIIYALSSVEQAIEINSSVQNGALIINTNWLDEFAICYK